MHGQDMDGEIACHMHEIDLLDTNLLALIRTLRTIQYRYCSSAYAAMRPPSSLNSIHVWSPKGLGRTYLVATCRLRIARRSRMPASTGGEETLVPAFSLGSTLEPGLKAFRRRVPKGLPPNVIFPQ
jgi:hypothetical protein